MVYKPEIIKAGFIFYPGGKAEYISYEPLMKACAYKGIISVFIKFPFCLVVFDINVAEQKRQMPECEIQV